MDNNYLLSIKRDIVDNKLKDAFDKLLKYTELLKIDDHRNSIILLHSRYIRLERDKQMGLLDNAFASSSENRIVFSLLNIIKELEKSAKSTQKEVQLKISEKEIGASHANKLTSYLQSKLGLTPVFKK